MQKLSFTQFYQELLNKSNQTKGKQFEVYFKQIISEFFLKSPKYKSTIQKIDLWSEWKYNWGQDIGIDLVAQTTDQEFIAIQCKFHTKEKSLKKDDVTPLLALANKRFDNNSKSFKHSFLVTTCQEISDNTQKAIEGQTIPCNIITYNDLLNANIDWTKEGIQEREPKKLREYQTKAIESVYKGFTEPTEDEEEKPLPPPNKGKLVMACGTGKTITALKIIERFAKEPTQDIKQVLFLVPSLSLLGQTVEEFNQERETEQSHLIVCSDKTIKTKQDTDDPLEDLELPATTNTQEIKNFLLQDTQAIKIVFSTYQSLDKIEEVQKDLSIKDFDLVLCDEAHRTTGVERGGNWQKIHKETIRKKKTLFMTATPRFYKDKNRADKQSLEVYSMDDKKDYGELFYSYRFHTAIGDNFLSDYKVIILTIPSGETKEFNFINHIQEQRVQRDLINFLKLEKITQPERKIHIIKSKEVTKTQIVKKNKEKINKLICFTNSIKNSKKVQRFLDNNQGIESQHIDGAMTGYKRQNKLTWLKEDENDKIKILSNAQCLSEGVNIPSVNGILFAEPKKSQIQVVQAVGRAIRKADKKDYGYIILPIIVPTDQDPDQFLEDTNYKHIWQVLKALRTHDKDIGTEIDLSKRKVYTPKHPSDVCQECGENPCICEYQPDFGFDQKIFLKIFEKCGDKKYLENWVADIEKIGKELLKKVRKEHKENTRFAQEFKSFHKYFRKEINKTITVANINTMLVQQLLTEPLFEALFPDKDILENNPIYKKVETLIAHLSFTKQELRTGDLKEFYQDIKKRAKGLESFEEKQEFLIELYEKFFKKFDSKEAEQRGLVYTPQELVKFMIRITDNIINKHFQTSLEDKDINIIDPFTGTGNFIINILKYFAEEKRLSNEIIKDNFLNNLYFNEIMLFPYYIACVNIQYYYQEKTGYKDNFQGATLVDTFTTLKKKQENITNLSLDENTQRIENQKKLPFKVIITNPPYKAQQTNANDDNKNFTYNDLDQRIKDTYTKKATNTGAKNALQDYYVKAFRWASDKIQDKGIIAFITNNQFLNSRAFSGFRICLEKEFSYIYHFDLKGNIRNIGTEDKRKQGQNVFNIMTGVGITILVKDTQAKEQGKINLYRIDDYTNKKEKLDIINKFENLAQIKQLEQITPQDSIWINPPKKEFKSFIPLGDKKIKASKEEPKNVVFHKYSRGISTARNSWAYDYSKATLSKKMGSMIDEYNKQLEEAKENPNYQLKREINKIKWSEDLEKIFNKNIELSFNPNQIVKTNYRPFSKQYLYYDKIVNQRTYQMPKTFPNDMENNLTFSITGLGSGDFSLLTTNQITDLSLVANCCQNFPYYFYHPKSKDTTDNLFTTNEKIVTNNFGEQLVKKENITSWALAHFRKAYNNNQITKWDIFYYCYGILHSQEYRQTYKDDLFREIARIPLLKSYQDFVTTSGIGKKLSDLHLNYETKEPNKKYFQIKEDRLLKNELAESFYKVDNKMKLAKRESKDEPFTLIYNQSITISDIPKELDNYKVNGRNVLAWLVANYQVKTLDNGYIKDPNNYQGGEYIYNLVLRLITVAIESQHLIKQLPPICNNYQGNQ